MASPHVAALAGLLAAQDRSAPEIRRRIQSTASDLGTEGKDKYFGWGLINANKAVRR
jgi:thermitase